MALANKSRCVSLITTLRFVSVCFYVLFLGLANGFSARHGIPQDARTAPGGWDREAAAKYLDERMDLWFTTAKKLRTGQSETTCVSCHTSVPYMLARPSLRLATHASTATPQE